MSGRYSSKRKSGKLTIVIVVLLLLLVLGYFAKGRNEKTGTVNNDVVPERIITITPEKLGF